MEELPSEQLTVERQSFSKALRSRCRYTACSAADGRRGNLLDKEIVCLWDNLKALFMSNISCSLNVFPRGQIEEVIFTGSGLPWVCERFTCPVLLVFAFSFTTFEATCSETEEDARLKILLSSVL